MHIKRNIDIKIVTILVGLVVLSGCALSNIGGIYDINDMSVYATGDGVLNTARASVTVSDACTMSVSGNQGTVGGDGNYTYSATIQGGTNGEIIANSIKTFCNDFSGFSIYAIGYSNDTLSNTDLVYNNTTTNDYNIKTDATGTYNSYWQMKLANSSNTVATTIPDTYQNYNVIPNDYTLVAQYNSNTGNTDATSSIITPSYKVYIASAQPAGTYTGKVKYTLVHPMNAAKPEIPNPIKDAFAAAGKEKYKGYYKMQDMTAAICADVVTPTTTTEDISAQLIDARDDKIYWVSKLKDGKCWMTQNLDLDLNASTLPLTNTTSDLNSKENWNPDSTYYTQNNEVTTSSSDNRHMYSWNLGDYAYDGTTNSSCGTSAESYENCTNYGFIPTSPTTAAANHYHVGNLYQWNTATAGSGGAITSGQAQDSICPKGWRLPTSNSGGEFQLLSNTYGATSGTSTSGTVQKLIDAPLYFVRGGFVYFGTLRYAGGRGYYWSSTPNPITSYAYRLYFGGTSTILPSDDGNRYSGMSVRCVADS